MHEPLRVLIGSLSRGTLAAGAAADPPSGTVLLDLGAEHPSQAGLLELRLWTENGVVTAAQVVVGAMHRGVEKLFEVRDYRQILMLADRHDWQAPFAGELGIALACEQLLGLEVPARAVWLRTLLAEHTRILSHLGFLGYLADTAAGIPELRERLRDQTLRLTGNRIHPMANRVGGLAVDAGPDWLAGQRNAMVAVRATADRLSAGLATSPRSDRLRSVAPLDARTVAAYGVTGPAARSSGVELDLRRHRPYLAYAELAELLTPTPHTEGDAHARLATLVHELRVSADLVQACADRLAGLAGPVAVRLGKIVKLPEGEVYRTTEAPLGVAGVFLVSRGEKTPWRLKLRTPSFNQVAALEQVLVGVATRDLEAALASVGYVVGDIDR
ncbi:MAG: NADH-quinone oxidoreductase subunit [Friedmanniella sp.]|nr:NADH-quinone oxidoreductase subunit [Friedmanniella sp.]